MSRFNTWEVTVRIISARRATPEEQSDYEEHVTN
jgi:uncharacterized DUF497 family protein